MPLHFGKTPTGLMVPLAISEAGEILVSGKDAGGTPRVPRVDSSGRLTILWTTRGYGQPTPKTQSFGSLAAGDVTKYMDAVPAGQVWQAHKFSIQILGTAPANTYLIFRHSSTDFYWYTLSPIVIGPFVGFDLPAVMVAGDQVGARMINSTLNNFVAFTLLATRID